MQKLISVDVVDGRGTFTGPHGTTGVIDLELEPNWKHASLTVRYGPNGYGVQAAIQQRGWDDQEWTPVAEVSVYANEEKTITAELDPARGELVRWSATSLGGVFHVVFRVSEENENE
jgi:hypothetical protein